VEFKPTKLLAEAGENQLPNHIEIFQATKYITHFMDLQ
jgi:hypothetical protein